MHQKEQNDTALPERVTWPDAWLEPVLGAMGVLRPENERRLGEMGTATLWEACVQCGFATHTEIALSVSRRFGMPVANVADVDVTARACLTAAWSRKLGIVPIRLSGRVLELACINPADPELERSAAFATGHRVRLGLTDPVTLARLQDMIYPSGASAVQLVDAVGPLAAEEGLLREFAAMGTAALSGDTPKRLVDALIIQAVRQRASDVHIEPHETGLGVRYRIDGTLHEMARLPRLLHAPVTSRLKVLANLDIADRMRPQDGRAQVQLAGRKVDLRISTLPIGSLGEKTVVRILDGGRSPATFQTLGFLDHELNRIERLFRTSDGLVLVTGPTGSGKTTTLYAALRAVQSTGVNVVTVEDPIEYRLDGVAQVQINERAGLTFASVLRSILRQDPDVVLVGEIRDRETAEVGLQASMTGHLVLSTLHTNDAPSAVMRLLDIGVDLTALAGSLRGVAAQRLVRRVCKHCRKRCDISELAAAQQALLADCPKLELYEAVGCPECNGIGYSGRLVIPEILLITPDIERAIQQRADIREIVELCRAAGMRTLWEAGVERVALGLTTLNELLDNITPPQAAFDSAEFNSAAQADVDRIFLSVQNEFAEARRPAVAPVPDPPAPPRAAVVRPNPERLRVLVVDDDLEARRALRAGLEREGFGVLEAADGQAALDYLKRSRPAVMVIELALPKIDGFGILRAIREGDAPAVRAIVLTVQDDPDLALWATELGALDVLLKPMDARLLANRLHGILSEAAA